MMMTANNATTTTTPYRTRKSFPGMSRIGMPPDGSSMGAFRTAPIKRGREVPSASRAACRNQRGLAMIQASWRFTRTKLPPSPKRCAADGQRSAGASSPNMVR